MFICLDEVRGASCGCSSHGNTLAQATVWGACGLSFIHSGSSPTCFSLFACLDEVREGKGTWYTLAQVVSNEVKCGPWVFPNLLVILLKCLSESIVGATLHGMHQYRQTASTQNRASWLSCWCCTRLSDGMGLCLYSIMSLPVDWVLA